MGGDERLEVYVLREVLHLHEILIGSLQAGIRVIAGRFHDGKTTGLLAELTADHEKDAFMLRAMLWEVENRAA